MENNLREKLTKMLTGERTQAKGAGLAFSVATVLPTLLALVLFIVLAFLGVGKESQSKDWFIYLNYALPQMSFAITAAVFFRYVKQSPVTAVKKQKCKGKYFIVALCMQIGLFSLGELNVLFLKFLEKFGYQDAGLPLPSMDGFGFVGVLFVIALLPAVFEEIMFRGILLSGLRSFKEWAAALLCGVLFALYHQNPAQTLYQFCCGTAFAFIAIRSGGILPTVLSHFFNNTLILTLYKCGIQSFTGITQAIVIGVSLLFLVGTLVYLFVFDKRQGSQEDKENTKDGKGEFFLFAAVGIFICLLTWISVLLTGI